METFIKCYSIDDGETWVDVDSKFDVNDLPNDLMIKIIEQKVITYNNFFQSSEHYANYVVKKLKHLSEFSFLYEDGNIDQAKGLYSTFYKNHIDNSDKYIKAKIHNPIQMLLNMINNEREFNVINRKQYAINQEALNCFDEIYPKSELNPYEIEKVFYNNSTVSLFNPDGYSLSEDAYKYIIGKKGLYFIYNDDHELIYIGKSKTLHNRVTSSLKERTGTYVRFLICNELSTMHILEPYLICKMKPKLNVEFNDESELELNIDHGELSEYFKVIKDDKLS